MRGQKIPLTTLDKYNNHRIYFGYMKILINIKADKEVKEGAQALAQELGLPLSVVVNAYLKDFVRNRGINISAVPRMSRQLETILGGVEKDLAARKNISSAFSSVKDAGRYLDSL